MRAQVPWRHRRQKSIANVYEVNHRTLTIWGGEKSSKAYYKGKWTNGGDTNTGAWVYPGGGGYEASMTRVALATERSTATKQNTFR